MCDVLSLPTLILQRLPHVPSILQKKAFPHVRFAIGEDLMDPHPASIVVALEAHKVSLRRPQVEVGFSHGVCGD